MRMLLFDRMVRDALENIEEVGQEAMTELITRFARAPQSREHRDAGLTGFLSSGADLIEATNRLKASAINSAAAGDRITFDGLKEALEKVHLNGVRSHGLP